MGVIESINHKRAILGPRAEKTYSAVRAAEFFPHAKVWMAACVAQTHGTTLMSMRGLVIKTSLPQPGLSSNNTNNATQDTWIPLPTVGTATS